MCSKLSSSSLISVALCSHEKKSTQKTQLLSVSCPTCGVAAGMHCQLYSGAPRAPHVNRKLSVLDMTERKAANRHKPEK
jgi:hypothetical protein